ncbi:MAG TPA: hypothetical protein DDZ67_00850 [Xanthomonadaceae bacterium]|nr:hypothetical protein [Xanthomonadaceae bacterium]
MLFKHLAESLKNPTYWTYSGWLDIITKYRRSRLGVLWMLVPPIFYVWGLGSYFASLQSFHVGNFVAHVGIGFLLFRMLMTVINDSSGTLSAHQAFILDGHTRLTDFVLLVAAKAVFYFIIALPILGVALWMADDIQAQGVWMSLLTMPVLLLNMVWMAVVFALLGARFPDVQELMGSLFIFGFVLTPIIWYGNLAPAQSLQGFLMRLNPLYHLIEIVRAPILGEPIAISTWYAVAGLTIVGWLLASVVYRRYARYVPIWL